MAFTSGKIKSVEDRKHVAAKGFKDIFGQPFPNPYAWAIDREKDIILISRGGGGLEVPEGYALYIDGEILDIEGYEKDEGSRFEKNLKIHWYISKIEVNKSYFQKNYKEELIRQYIKDAFTAYGCRNLKPEQILEVTVEINAVIQNKCNNRGEEI